MTIYSLYNKKVGFYNPPTFSNMDKDATKANLYRFCLLNQADARKSHYDECDLYFLGEFDDIKCEFKILDKPEFLLDLGPAFQIPGE